MSGRMENNSYNSSENKIEPKLSNLHRNGKMLAVSLLLGVESPDSQGYKAKPTPWLLWWKLTTGFLLWRIMHVFDKKKISKFWEFWTFFGKQNRWRNIFGWFWLKPETNAPFGMHIIAWIVASWGTDAWWSYWAVTTVTTNSLCCFSRTLPVLIRDLQKNSNGEITDQR